MKALVVGTAGKVEIRQIDRPRPASHQALVKTIGGGICGTDGTLLHGSFKGIEPAQYPLVLGHESVGRVVEVGTDVTSYTVGDVVLLPFVPNPTEAGRPLGSAWGAFSEFTLVDDIAAFEAGTVAGPAPEAAVAQSIVPASIEPLHAPVIVTLREVLSSIYVSGIDVAEPVVIYGSGPVAMTFARLLRLLGATQIIAVVRSEEKASLMQQFGATTCINSRAVDVAGAVGDLLPGGVGAVIDAVGHPSVINEALPMLRDRGILFCYGVPKEGSMHIDWSRAPYNWTLKFQQMPRKDEEGACHQQVIDWVESGDLVLGDFVSDVVPIDEAPAFFADYLGGKTSGKIVLSF
ncbi:zinc-binding dehydrogenase [Ornithinimicrobium pratense]|uniref:Zinc-binding dehydrogenase n=2 Tax=Ornithinimicrobium pratense TaxID=2593973 RepID=A0A5J6V9A6_9MICO|nr:zinc-binding dehydrogenase [Ornithinimicrobium pratense]